MIRMRSLAVLAIFMAAFSACDGDRTQSLTGPEAQFSDWQWAQPVTEVVTTTDTSETTTVVAVVGTAGAKIQNGDHILVIPRKAVSGDTQFTFTVVGGTNIHVDLSAQSVATGTTVSTFAQALTLKLNYRTANISDPSRLVVAWLVDGTIDGAKQAMPSSVDTKGKYVNGSLTHFSDYVIGIN